MERLVFILFDFGYAITFGILGIVTFLLNVRKKTVWKAIRKPERF